MATQNDDGSTYNAYVLYTARTCAEGLNQWGGELIQQNLTEFQPVARSP